MLIRVLRRVCLRVASKVRAHGHSANALKSRYLTNCWSYGIVFNMYTRIITHGEQNVTLTSKVRGQGLRTNAVNSNISYRVDFDKYTYIM